MIEKSNIELFADFITLVYHEARNVRHLIKGGYLDATGLEKLISLPKNRESAWKELQSLHIQVKKQATAKEACEVFSHRFGKTLEDLKEIYANSNWKHAKDYGGNAWESITKDVLRLAQAIDNQDLEAIEEILSKLQNSYHNNGRVVDKLSNLNASLRNN